jgi:glucuronoarabinoxylan endo-1,4-beta-xylanase
MKQPLMSSLGGACALAFFLGACEPEPAGPQGDSQTNWLISCRSDADCGALSCLCGVCTLACDEDSACAGASGSSCVPTSETGVAALCGAAQPPSSGLCLPSCEDAACAEGQQCVSGVCEPLAGPGARLSVDASTRYQRLTGFGATVGYAEDSIAGFSNRSALDAAMFQELGLDIVRLRNRHEGLSGSNLMPAREVVAAATRSLGRPPLVLLTSWSPPGSLKQNGAAFCEANPETCRLIETPSGELDYAAFAAHWRASLEAYASVGIVPDYIGIQNNPDWVPGPGSMSEACRFAPDEFAAALAAVRETVLDLPVPPRILAPELSGTLGTEAYFASLDVSAVHAIAHHMYDTDPTAIDLTSLSALGSLAGSMSLPLFQTEMQADGFGTALLIHHALAVEGAAMYLQTALIGPLTGPLTNPMALIGLEGDAFTLQDPYFSMLHYARFTDPGWSRVQVSSSNPGLLASGWLSPDEASLTLVLINHDWQELSVAIDGVGAGFGAARLMRTVFDGTERAAELGAWPPGASLPLPPRSIATLSFGPG